MTNEVENDEYEDEVGSPAIVPNGPISFLLDPKDHSLAKTKKQLNSKVKAAIDYLASVVANDEEDTKTRIQAANKIIDSTVQVNTEINKETLHRLTMQVKQQMDSMPRSMKNIRSDDGEDEERGTPVFNPSVILSCDNLDNL